MKKAALWAKVNKVPFPKIDESVYDREGMKEVYVFEEPDDPACPIIFLFPMVNLTFKEFKKPGKYIIYIPLLTVTATKYLLSSLH